MIAAIKNRWKYIRNDKKRAYTKTARLGGFIFGLVYTSLLVIALLFGNIYINVLTIGITSILMLSTVKLLAARVAIKVNKLKNRNFTAIKGSKVTVKIDIKNRFIFTYPVCKVYIKTDEGLVIPEGYDEKVAFGLSALTENTYYYAVYCPYRGQYKIGAEVMHIWDDIGLKYVRKKIDEYIVLTVYPNIVGIEGFDDVKRKEEEKLGYLSKETADYSDSMEIRDYKEQDSLRQIHWKLSSRMDKLMSKKYYAAQSNRLCVYFDISLPASYLDLEMIKRHEMIDKISEVCTAVCNYFTQDKVPYNCIYYFMDDIKCVECDTLNDFDGVHYLLASLDFKTDYSKGHTLLGDFIQNVEGTKSVIYIFTLNITEELIYSLKEISYLDYNPVLIYIAEKDAVNIGMAEKAKAHCARFLTIYTEDNIKSAWENF